MFFYTAAFNQPLADWDVSEVTDMGSMFGGAPSFNQPLADWDVSKVKDMWGICSIMRKTLISTILCHLPSSCSDELTLFSRTMCTLELPEEQKP